MEETEHTEPGLSKRSDQFGTEPAGCTSYDNNTLRIR
jgi:hypothetical protein